jgi:hypothetical protein
MVGLAHGIHGGPGALARILQFDAPGDRLKRQRTGNSLRAFTDRQPQSAIVQVGQAGLGVRAVEVELEAALHQAVRAPAVTAAERVGAFGGALAQQRLGHGGGRRQRQAHALLLEQHGLFARDQRGVEVGFSERVGARHHAQELHVGRQADDVGLGQRFIQPGQRLLARVAVHDELGHHGVVERADGVALAHAGVHAHRAALKGHAVGQAVHGERPVAGRKLLSGFSAQMRASMAWPVMRSSSCCSGSGSPAATRNCHSTRSWPVMASVTGCSTCRRVFISMKKKFMLPSRSRPAARR